METLTRVHLQVWRHQLGLTPAALARALGVARSTVNRWEAGENPIPPWVTRAMRDLERERSTPSH